MQWQSVLLHRLMTQWLLLYFVSPQKASLHGCPMLATFGWRCFGIGEYLDLFFH